MKDRGAYIIILFAILVGLLIAVIFFIIPKAAAISLPYKWNRIPVDQKRFVVHQYLGKPEKENISAGDKWFSSRENGAYVLTVFYDKDSLATNYKLVFNYKLGFFRKQYDLTNKEQE